MLRRNLLKIRKDLNPYLSKRLRIKPSITLSPTVNRGLLPIQRDYFSSSTIKFSCYYYYYFDHYFRLSLLNYLFCWLNSNRPKLNYATLNLQKVVLASLANNMIIDMAHFCIFFANEPELAAKEARMSKQWSVPVTQTAT